MKYKNKMTGAIIDATSSMVGDWFPFSQKNLKKIETNQIQETDYLKEEMSEQNTIVEEKTNNPALDDITKADIMQELDAFGIKYDKSARKQALYDLMMEQGKE